jgi:hypothetical protein
MNDDARNHEREDTLRQFLLVNITKPHSAAKSLNVIPPTNYFRQCHSESFLCPLHT